MKALEILRKFGDHFAYRTYGLSKNSIMEAIEELTSIEQRIVELEQRIEELSNEKERLFDDKCELIVYSSNIRNELKAISTPKTCEDCSNYNTNYSGCYKCLWQIQQDGSVKEDYYEPKGQK